MVEEGAEGEMAGGAGACKFVPLPFSRRRSSKAVRSSAAGMNTAAIHIPISDALVVILLFLSSTFFQADPSKMPSKTTTVLVTTGASVVGLALAASLGLLLVVPALRNSCTLFNKQCVGVTYSVLPNGELLVKDPRTDLTYWYDGAFIRSYGPNLPGTCPNSVALGATGAYEEVGEPRVLCDRFDANGECVSQDAVATRPTAMAGTPISNSGTGERLLEPAFIMNGSTLEASEKQVLCSRARGAVENSFGEEVAREGTVKMRMPAGGLDVAHIFKVLKANGVYVPPAANPEPPVCNGHGEIDPSTTLCVCEPGWTGARCATQMCTDDAECGAGSCNGGVCVCEPGWTGARCDLQACEAGCVNGVCDFEMGACVCTAGFEGETCEDMVCIPGCGPAGTCNPSNGLCECEEGWVGITCDNVACPKNCSGNGDCLAPDGVCECVHGWVGEACDTVACTNNCSQRGECDMSDETCICDAGWSGEDCSTPLCTNGCCEHGVCAETDGSWGCTCSPGWGGGDCGIPDDPHTAEQWCPTA